jgi:diguanylate cyclase (GGDEF)-like protein/PAS domain S-box-containing protein
MEKMLRVLFVEDSADDAELAAAELSRGGFKFTTSRVETLPDMQAALTDAHWDLIISDYEMPRFSADQALETLKSSGKDIPFIILSGVVQAEEAVALMRRGAHDFLSKEAMVRLVPAVERELREAAERYNRRLAEERVRTLSLAVEQSPVSVVITNENGIIEYVNPKFEEVTNFSLSEAVGRNLNFTIMDQTNEGLFQELWDTVKGGRSWHGEFCNVRKDGEIFWEYANVSPLKNIDGVITNYIAVKEDITVRRSYEEQLLKQAHYDDLTGLANRALMLDRLNVAIKIAIRNKEQAALLCIDLDRFKNINDTLGHTVGDELLCEAAARLGTCIRDCDTLARMGGDEFVIILPQIEDNITVRRVAERVLDVFSKPFMIGNQEHLVTASIGIVLFPTDGKDHQVLLRNADLAMYKAKDLGRNRYQFFTEEINRKLKHRMELETRLRKVVPQRELVLHYQPIVDIKSHLPVAYEVLVRWRREDGALHMPASFIPLAEDIGLIKEIGEWVVSTACLEVSSILECNAVLPRIAVNVSPKQLQVKGFAAYVKHQLIESGLQPERLDLEITERVLVDDMPETHINLKSLCDFGISLSIDDFGTGYSSLGYLQKYPFSTLKIDRGFISNIVSNKNSARLVETIITMAHGLGLKVIAEGVETSEQFMFLSLRSCDLVQGFYFGQPMPLKNLVGTRHVGRNYDARLATTN